MNKTDDAREGDDNLLRADEAADGAPEDGDDNAFEVEHEGQVYRLPGALQGGFLRQAVGTHAGHKRLQAGGEAAERMAQTGQVLQREIDGWSPELAGKLVDYAQGHGVSLDELGAADDPRVWKILHRAWQGDKAGQR